MKEEHKPENTPKASRSWTKKIFRWFIGILILLLLISFVLTILVQNEKFQNWAVGKVTKSLSEKLETKVSLDYINLEFFDNLSFDNFYIQDYNKDTLLHVDNLNVDFDLSIGKILRREYTINEIYLRDGTVKLRRDSAQFLTNINELLEKLSKTEEEKKLNQKARRPINLELDYLSLENINFKQKDLLRGQNMHGQVEKGKFIFEDFKIDENLINLNSIVIDGFNMNIFEYSRNDELFNKLWDEDFMNNIFYPEGKIDILLDTTSAFKEPKPPLVITANSFTLHNGNLTLHNHRQSSKRQMPVDVLDYKHIDVYEVETQINNFSFTPCEFTGQIESLSCKEKSGLVISNVSAKDVFISEQKVLLNGVKLKTPYSTIGDTITLKFRKFSDWWDFQDKVRLDVRFNDSKIGLQDIVYFGGALKQNPFFEKNINESLFVDGKLVGRINSLGARDISLKLGERVSMKGTLRTRNITLKNEEFFDLKLDYLTTNMLTLKELIPGFNPPDQFYKLGNLNFGGTFFGFLHDFTADGQLNSDLGQVNSDLKLVLIENKQDANYSGRFSLTDFDLASWTDNDKFGKVTMSAFIKEGRGIKIDNASAKLNAVVNDFTYQGYEYKNVKFNGELNKNRLNGALDIKDDNIALDFEGDINFEEETPDFNFESKIKKLNLKQLNLSKKDIFVSGNFDLSLKGKKIKDITGEANILDLNLRLDDSISYHIDTVNIVSEVLTNGDKVFDLESDLFNASLEGNFILDQFPFALQDYIYEQHPKFSKRLKLKKSGKEISPHRFDFDVEVFDSKNLSTFIHPDLDTIKNTQIIGYLDNQEDSIYLEANFPRFKFGNIDLHEGTIYIDGNKEKDDIVFGVLDPIINGKNHFPSAMLTASIEEEKLFFNVGLSNFKQKQVDQVLIRGELAMINDEDFELVFEPSNLTILGDQWDIPADNSLRFGKDFIEIENFFISNGEQEIIIQSNGQKGIDINVANIDMLDINEYINYNLLDFAGAVDINLSAKDVFTLEDLSFDLRMDTFLIITTHTDTNTHDWGRLTFSAESDDIESKINTKLQIGFLEEAKDRLLTIDGYYLPPTVGKSKHDKNYFAQDIELTKYPLDIVSYFIPSGISGMEGEFNGKIKVFGTPLNPNIRGEVDISDGAVGIDYLGTTYYFDEATVSLDNEMIGASGETIRDKNGNIATLRGGIRHEKLKNLDLDLDIVTDNDRFLCLDTKKSPESLFYGVGVGSGSAEFRGPFNKTNISIDAVTSDSTSVIIPLEESTKAEDLSFIKFVKREEKDSVEIQKTEFRGVNIDLNLGITDEAEVKLIFDEKAGDIVQGKGIGNINIDVKRTGEFTMYGDYIIEEGNYLFTYSYRDLLKFNKPFVVKRGGSITWSGDPYEAQINLEAEYEGLKSPVYNLISEYLDIASEEIKAEARSQTPINLSMFLEGELFKPNISFKLQFPELTGEVKGYVDNKMRVLQADENELNRQVFGLMMNIGFLPATDGAIGGDEALTFGVNTFSQFISNQLSLYVSEFLSDIISKDGIYSGAEFNVNYTVYDVGDLESLDRVSELSLQLENYLFNDRVAVKIGTDFGIGDDSVVNTDDSVLNTFDVVVEWVIAKDRRFKLIVYNKNDQTIIGPQTKRGVGFNYRYEFDNLQEFFDGVKGSSKKRKNKKQNK